MVKRCILIFPDFSNMATIAGVRDKYDPIAGLVGPHITLVFPFDSDIGTAELNEHIRTALAGVQPFRLTLQGMSMPKSFGNYLLLHVHTGKYTLKDIHKRLYTGILASYLPQWCRTFEPHMTVGKLDDPAVIEQAVEATRDIDDLFETCVREIAVEIIGEDESSTIESVFTLPIEAE